jgi:hypothetical protein
MTADMFQAAVANAMRSSSVNLGMNPMSNQIRPNPVQSQPLVRPGPVQTPSQLLPTHLPTQTQVRPNPQAPAHIPNTVSNHLGIQVNQLQQGSAVHHQTQSHGMSIGRPTFSPQSLVPQRPIAMSPVNGMHAHTQQMVSPSQHHPKSPLSPPNQQTMRPMMPIYQNGMMHPNMQTRPPMNGAYHAASSMQPITSLPKSPVNPVGVKRDAPDGE